MKTSELIRAARKRFEAAVAEAHENKRPVELRALVDSALFDAAGGAAGYLLVLEAEAVLERIASPSWAEYTRAFDALPSFDEMTLEQWQQLKALGLRAQREKPLREWLEAPERRFEEVQTVFTRAFGRAVKEERENG